MIPTPAPPNKKSDEPTQRKSNPLNCRFHDLRHTACTRLLERGVSYPVVSTIMGWSAATAIRMAKRYEHIGQKAMREAMALLDRSQILAESPKNPPKSKQLEAASLN